MGGSPFDRHKPVRRMNGRTVRDAKSGTCLPSAEGKRAASGVPLEQGPDSIFPRRIGDLEGVFVVGRLDRAAPRPVELLQHLLRRGAARVDDALQRIQVAAFV